MSTATADTVRTDTALVRRVMTARYERLRAFVYDKLRRDTITRQEQETFTACAAAFCAVTVAAEMPLPIESLRSHLDPFRDTRGFFFAPENISDFLNDLAIAEHFERGGLPAINAFIQDRLDSLRRLVVLHTDKQNDADRRYMVQVAEQLNAILYRILYVYPPALSARVQLTTVTQKQDLDRIGRRLGSDHLRGHFNRFCECYAQEQGKPFDGTFVVEMPYAFSTGTHGSGQRAAQGQSHKSMLFDTTHAPNKDYDIPVLKLAITLPVVTWDHARFGIDEVAEVTILDTVRTYTPWYGPRIDQQFLLPRRSPLFHYLAFRNFASGRGCRSLAEVTALLGAEIPSERYARYDMQLLEPHGLDYELQREAPVADERSLERLFLIDTGPESAFDALPRDHRVELLEFVNRPVHGNNSHAVNMAVFVSHRESHGTASRIHTGPDAIIRRLAEIPVSTRSF